MRNKGKGERWTKIGDNKMEKRLGLRAEVLSKEHGVIAIFGGVTVEGAEWNPSHWFNDLWYLQQ
jgi:hypothetical protein